MSSLWVSRWISDHRRALAGWAIGASALAAGCGVHTALAPGAAPQGPPRPAFDHAGHIGRGLECADCHEGLKDERPGMPDVEFCMECHEDIDGEKPPEKRVAAWFDTSGKPVWSSFTKLDPELVFSHKNHVAKGLDCKACHKGIEEATTVGPELGLDMDACMACHTERKAPNECATCHGSYGTAEWMPDSHDLMWTTLHGQAMRRGGTPKTKADRCELCHSQDTCNSCHRSEAPRDHSNAWRVGGGHGLASALDRNRCSTCHETHDCTTCHENARPRSHRASWGAPRDRHCVHCHDPLRPNNPDGCAVCHKSTPSHDMAPRQPAWHAPDFECRLCHTDLRHVDDGRDCNRCHR